MLTLLKTLEFTLGLLPKRFVHLPHLPPRLDNVNLIPPPSSDLPIPDADDSDDLLVRTALFNESPMDEPEPVLEIITKKETRLDKVKKSRRKKKNLSKKRFPVRSGVGNGDNPHDTSLAEDEAEGKGKFKRKRINPTHFAAIPINDPEIVRNLIQVQNEMIASEEVFKGALINKNKFHFTLDVFRLEKDNPEDFQKARSALNSFWEYVKVELRADPLLMKIQGLDHFKNNVVFAKLQDPQRIQGLAQKFRQELHMAGLEGEKRPFKPHVTIAKLSKDVKLIKKKIRAFPPEIWTLSKDKIFGEQKLEKVEILSMVDPADPKTGCYYQVASCSLEEGEDEAKAKDST